ncbi:hypothetical protein ACQ4LK_20975, partial [Bacillus pumilus]
MGSEDVYKRQVAIRLELIMIMKNLQLKYYQQMRMVQKMLYLQNSFLMEISLRLKKARSFLILGTVSYTHLEPTRPS